MSIMLGLEVGNRAADEARARTLHVPMRACCHSVTSSSALCAQKWPGLDDKFHDHPVPERVWGGSGCFPKSKALVLQVGMAGAYKEGPDSHVSFGKVVPVAWRRGMEKKIRRQRDSTGGRGGRSQSLGNGSGNGRKEPGSR